MAASLAPGRRGRYLAPLIDPEIGFAAWMPIVAPSPSPACIAHKVCPARWHREPPSRAHRALRCRNVRLVPLRLCPDDERQQWRHDLREPLRTVADSPGLARDGHVESLPRCPSAGHDAHRRSRPLRHLSELLSSQSGRALRRTFTAGGMADDACSGRLPATSEVFVERELHIDGGPRVSAADPVCQLMFILAAHSEQPCALTLSERVSLQQKFAGGDAAVWVRRSAQGAGSVTTATRVMIGSRPAPSLPDMKGPGNSACRTGAPRRCNGVRPTTASSPVGAGSDRTSSPQFS